MNNIKEHASQWKYILDNCIDTDNHQSFKDPESLKKILQRMSDTVLTSLGFYEPYDRKSLYFNSIIDLKYKIPKFILDKITKPNTKKQRTIVQLLEGSRELRDGESMDCEWKCRTVLNYFKKMIRPPITTNSVNDKLTDSYFVNFIFDIKYQFEIVASTNGMVISIRFKEYCSTLLSSTNTELGIPTGSAPISPATRGFDALLLK